MKRLQVHLQIVAVCSLLSFNGIAFAVSQDELNRSMTPTELRIDKLRNGEIHQLQLVLSRSGAKEMQPDLMLRLAELYTEKYRLFFFKENEVWTKKMDEYLSLPPAQAKYRAKPVVDGASSKQWLSKAVTVLQAIPLQKIQYSRVDEVYYFLAFNQWELGRKSEAVKSFEKIAESYPNSKFLSEAHRYLADFAFANREFDKSKRNYERAAKAPSSPARPRILYGLAWSNFKLQNYKAAVSTMRDAIQLGRENAESAKQGLALQRDAAESLALFYSEGGNVDEAAAFFTTLFGDSEGALVLRKLSDFYQRQGKYANALAVNKQLLSLGGEAAKQGEEQRFEIMVASLNIATTKGDANRRAALLKAMTAEFVTGAANPDEEKVEILRTQVRKAATLAHREGNKSNSPRPSHERAEDLYRLYLTAFGSKVKSDDAAEVHWYLADVLNQLGKQKEAVAEYRFVIDQAESDPAYRKYQRDAASALVYSMNSYFKAKGDAKQVPKVEADQVIAAIDSYVKSYPDDKQVTEYLARAAGILVVSGRMDEARPRLHVLIDQHSGSKEAWDAASTLLKEAKEKKDPETAQRLAQAFLSNEGLMAQDRKGEFRNTLQAIIDRSRFDINLAAEKNDPNFAARNFEKQASETKNPEIRMKALNNAAVIYGRSGDQNNEMRVYEHTLKVSPGNAQAEKSFLNLANEHFVSGRYMEAAEVYERFYRAYKPKLASLKAKSQKEALESLRSAALLRRALKQNDKASEDFRDLVDAANKGIGAARSAAGEFLFDIAKRLRDEGNITEAVRSFQKYSTAFPDGPHAIGATMETAILYVKLKEEEKAQSYYRATISKVKVKGAKATPEDLGYAARARLELLGPLEEAYEKSPIRLPEARLKSDIQAKLQALDRLGKGYIEVMDFGDGQWGVEAYRRMALAYRSFANKVEAAPIPENYSPEDKAKFKASLKNVAVPVYLKVTEFLDFALNTGEKLQVVGPNMARVYILSALNSAKPERLPLLQFPDWSKPADWLMGDLSGSEINLEKNRASLRKNPSDLAAWNNIGNYHLLKGEDGLAEIFYLFAINRNAKFLPAINNLAYLRGKSGDLQKGMAGFKSVLGIDEFALVTKKNISRLQMGAGLWRHASQNYRQLEVRLPNDKEVKRGIALAALANGKTAQAEASASLLTDSAGDNRDFAEAVLALAKGNREKANELFGDMAGRNEFASLIMENWNSKGTK